MTSGVYKITNTVTGKCYIGSSVNIERRWTRHKCLLNKAIHHAKHMQNSWNKYGEKAFIFEIVFECASIKDIILFYEQLWIDFYGFENLYNHNPTTGSPLGTKQSDEAKEKCRIAKINKMISVIHINMSGEVIGEYKSISEASRKTSHSRYDIRESIHKYHRCGMSMFVKSTNDIEKALLKHAEIMVQITNVRKNNARFASNARRKRIAQFNKDTSEDSFNETLE